MGMIIRRADIRTAFERVWTASYVPSLMRYGERSERKAMKDCSLWKQVNKINMKRIPFLVVSSHVDDSSRQKVALEILVAAMMCSNVVHCIYQEYEFRKRFTISIIMHVINDLSGHISPIDDRDT